MDIERALLKAGVTVAAMFAIYQSSQGMQEFAKQRSADANQKSETQQSEQLERPDDYIESLRLAETKRRYSESADVKKRVLNVE
ncbi:hypothetical protein [Stutzerimonas frequens]|uniref:hypothetical protein n=1 Tax=Stutzerimonas frequens TaxID=2968969 RepID=UPI00190A3FF2|nr:hypothetical protein [Stutzerimonas frequens]MBK3870470.1 hypothetical protein [Stutzerimonas frequens]MBK3908807.1 hypothetical protein [Stutzerimonas frequens]MBK3929596.1 hypothetical protein [Stutzerimonas frequens]